MSPEEQIALLFIFTVLGIGVALFIFGFTVIKGRVGLITSTIGVVVVLIGIAAL